MICFDDFFISTTRISMEVGTPNNLEYKKKVVIFDHLGSWRMAYNHET